MRPFVACLLVLLAGGPAGATGSAVWPSPHWSERAPSGGDSSAIEGAVEALFEPVGYSGAQDTRALLVVQGGRLVFERYAEGFDRTTRFQSWSMAKSVTQTLVGILVREERLDLDAGAPVVAWQGEGDPRGALTLRNLLNMNTGLANGDGFGDNPADTFVARLLFGEDSADAAAAAADVPLVHEPGTHWAYSTGTSMIVARIVGETVGSGRQDTAEFIARSLAEPLGITSLVPEFDAAGTFLGGAFVHATARDWARLGLLYLRDGVWGDTRILPEGWVAFTRTPAPAENNGVFGAHFWLTGKPAEGQFNSLGAAPPDTFQMNGNNGQMVAIVPSRDLVVVRLGELQSLDWAGLSHSLSGLINAFPESEGER